jgi:hypothetical protein
MNLTKARLNDLMTIGGVATKNNFYSETAVSAGGIFCSALVQFKKMLGDQLIRPLQTVTRVRNKRQEMFYTITAKGANYIGRKDELKSKDPKSPDNVMHESMKYDIALSFVRNYRDYDITFRYDMSINGIRPDIVVFLEDRHKGLKYNFLVEIERKKTIERVYKEKILKYEEALKTDLRQFGLRPETKVLVVYADINFDAYLRPLEYSKFPYILKEISLMEKRIKKLSEMCKSLPDRYRFIPFSSFDKIKEPIWLTPRNTKVALI